MMRKRILIFLALFQISGLATAQTLIFSPQRATGWEGVPHESCEYKTEFWVLNLTQRSVSGTAIFTDQLGRAVLQTVTTPDGESKILSVFPFSLKVGESKLVSLSLVPNCFNDLSVGTIAFLVSESFKSGDTKLTPDIGVSVVFKRVDLNGNVTSAAGVPVSECLEAFSLSAEINEGTDTGFALYNPNPASAHISISLVINGQTAAVNNFVLNSGEQMAKYIGQMFPGFNNFSGHAEYRSDQKLAVTGLKLYFSPNSYVFSGIPTIPIK
jgi:hypothetical protein